MPFEAYFLAVDADLGRELDMALGDARSLLRPVSSPAALFEAAAGAALFRAVIALEDAAHLDAAWWRAVRERAPQSQLLIAARVCDEETWRRWVLLGAVGVIRPPFPALDLEAEFAGEPALSNVFHRSPALAAHGKTMFRYTFPSDPQFIPGIVHVIALLALEFGFSTADYMTHVPLALDEAISNAIRHGNRRDLKKRVEVEGQIDAESLRFKVRDEGQGFERDPDHNPVHPDNLLAPSGRGLFLIESVMDEVRYSQEGRCIEMVKRAKPQLKRVPVMR